MSTTTANPLLNAARDQRIDFVSGEPAVVIEVSGGELVQTAAMQLAHGDGAQRPAAVRHDAINVHIRRRRTFVRERLIRGRESGIRAGGTDTDPLAHPTGG